MQYFILIFGVLRALLSAQLRVFEQMYNREKYCLAQGIFVTNCGNINASRHFIISVSFHQGPRSNFEIAGGGGGGGRHH